MELGRKEWCWGMGFWIYLCYSKKSLGNTVTLKQEAIVVVLVPVLGVQDFFLVAWVTPHLAVKTDSHQVSYPYHLTQEFLPHLLIPQIRKCSKGFVCLFIKYISKKEVIKR